MDEKTNTYTLNPNVNLVNEFNRPKDHEAPSGFAVPTFDAINHQSQDLTMNTRLISEFNRPKDEAVLIATPTAYDIENNYIETKFPSSGEKPTEKTSMTSKPATKSQRTPAVRTGSSTRTQTPAQKEQAEKEAVANANQEAKKTPGGEKNKEGTWWERNREWILWTLGGLALGTVAILGFRKGGWWNKNKSSSNASSASTNTAPETQANVDTNTGVSTHVSENTNSVTNESTNGLLNTLNQNSSGTVQGGVQLKDMAPVNLAQGRE